MSGKEMTPDERLAKRLDDYMTMPGLEFSSPEAEALYRERATLIRDAFEMNEPARVPVFPAEDFFPCTYEALVIDRILLISRNRRRS